MATTIRNFNERGEIVGVRIVADVVRASFLSCWNFFDDPTHRVISTTNEYEAAYTRYEYIREQLELNSIRTGANLVDEERTRHILEGAPIERSVRVSNGASGKTTTVRGWSGGHANPDAAQFGKTQIPDFWTGDRFMYEVSDILSDANSHWRLQENYADIELSGGEEERPERYVCVEERYGVPIRVVAERVDDSMKCVTAFPDYRAFPLDERMGRDD